MTDEFDALRAALKSTPAPDAAAKAADLALALDNFDKIQASRQGSPDQTRLDQDRPMQAGFLTKVRLMLKSLSARPYLAATTSAAALMLGVVLVLPMMQHRLPPVTTVTDTKPAPQVSNLTAIAPEPQPQVSAAAPAPPLPKAEDRLAATTPTTRPAPKPVMEAPLPPANPADRGALADKAPSPNDTALAAAIAEAGPAQAAPPSAGAATMANPEALQMDSVAPSPVPMAKRSAQASGLVSTPDVLDMPAIARLPTTEAFANAPQNPVHVTAEEPVSTFSADIDTAAYAIIRSSLNAGQLPPPEAVRIEEMVNYFPYDLPQPGADQPFQPTISVLQTPWNPNTKLVHIALQGRKVSDRPPLNLIFLIDTSGSMDEPNKLPLLKQSLALMLPKLSPNDRVAIVTYAGSAGEVLPPTRASDRATILNALDNLAAGGSTAGAAGLTLAYQVADKMAEPGRTSRILLATDGDFNVGIDNPDDLKTFIAHERTNGTYLSVLGFGRGNLDDATMQALAQNGNGTASYIDTLSEAQKVLGDQLTGALFPIADDVKIQVEWNPAQVAEYRLIGYETRALRREDFNNDKVDAGEIGAGLQVTALYEVTPVGSPALLNDALRYAKTPETGASKELGFLRLRYKNPGEANSHLIETPISPDTTTNPEASFAAAIAGFGQLLEHSTYLGNWRYAQAIQLATAAKGPDPYGYRAEAVTLMRLAQSLSAE